MTWDESHLWLACECGARLTVNDEYLFDDIRKVWNEWHEDGAFLAGRWHRPMPADEVIPSTPSTSRASDGDGGDDPLSHPEKVSEWLTQRPLPPGSRHGS